MPLASGERSEKRVGLNRDRLGQGLPASAGLWISRCIATSRPSAVERRARQSARGVRVSSYRDDPERARDHVERFAVAGKQGPGRFKSGYAAVFLVLVSSGRRKHWPRTQRCRGRVENELASEW